MRLITFLLSLCVSLSLCAFLSLSLQYESGAGAAIPGILTNESDQFSSAFVCVFFFVFVFVCVIVIVIVIAE